MSNPGVYQLFVYGTLRSGFKSPVYEYISGYFSFIGEGKVKGKLFDMGNYPAGIPTNENVFIVGELYAINNPAEFSWAIGQLDDYEGVSVEPDEVQLYRREITEVHMNDATASAWIYWYNGDTSGRPLVATGDIFDYLKAK
jgi:gamma-glutamylcyclotransferase (GGCT)/AIG2-like uncharacterized protein YtfP